MMKQYLLFLVFLPLASASANPMQILQKQIKKSGYILYRNPMEEAGTGTLVGGTPKQLSIVAHPQTCFPDQVIEDLKLRHVDNSAIGNMSQKVTFGGKVKFDVMKFLGNANSILSVKAGFDMVETVELEFEGVKVEYLDSILLKEIYLRQMSSTCRDFLDQVAFIIQALRVDKMKFAFKRSTGAYIELNANAIQEILDIAVDAHFTIEKGYILSFDTPKYIGYQLGRLRPADGGIALYRASSVMMNKFKFKSIGVFEQQEEPTPETPNPARELYNMSHLNLPPIDPWSIFQD